jgi:mono/diheme cytochrome c family protein
MARLEPEWVASYLADPYDLRPAMPETMVRLGLSTSDIQQVASWFATHQSPPPKTPAPNKANLEAGKQLFQTRGCIACHSFGSQSPGPGIPAAPDLRHARDRMSDDMIVAWILNPQRLSPAATMPAMGLTEAEAIAVRDYLVLADPGGKPAVALKNRIAPASREVHWPEVEEKVFGKICVHCHMDPAQNDGRAGPGNAGGFGWAATGIELQTREGVKAHAPAILSAMLRRREEAARDRVGPGEIPASIVRPPLPGMPLGLPPIPDEEIALVSAWIAAGCPE